MVLAASPRQVGLEGAQLSAQDSDLLCQVPEPSLGWDSSQGMATVTRTTFLCPSELTASEARTFVSLDTAAKVTPLCRPRAVLSLQGTRRVCPF